MSEEMLPHTFDDFTAAWFTKALSTRFPGVKVAGFSRTGERIGTSASCKFSLDYADTGAVGDPPGSVYIKGGFTEKQRNRYWVVLQQEVRFFNEMAQDVPMNIPDCYFAACDAERQGLTMLEDIVQTRGATFGNWGALTVDQVAALLEQFACMHARWSGDPRLGGLAGFEKPQREFFQYVLRDKHWEELKTRKFGHRLEKVFPDVRLLRDALQRMWELNDAAPRTLCHGDAHGGNMFFERDGKPGVLDFQLYFAGTYMHDVSWLIVSALSIEDRRREEQRLLRHYLEAARASGMEVYSFDQAWLIYRQQMAHAVPSGACNPIESGPIAMINAAGEVVTTAAEDLDVLGALGIPRR